MTIILRDDPTSLTIAQHDSLGSKLLTSALIVVLFGMIVTAILVPSGRRNILTCVKESQEDVSCTNQSTWLWTAPVLTRYAHVQKAYVHTQLNGRHQERTLRIKTASGDFSLPAYGGYAGPFDPVDVIDAAEHQIDAFISAPVAAPLILREEVSWVGVLVSGSLLLVALSWSVGNALAKGPWTVFDARLGQVHIHCAGPRRPVTHVIPLTDIIRIAMIHPQGRSTVDIVLKTTTGTIRLCWLHHGSARAPHDQAGAIVDRIRTWLLVRGVAVP
jgi:hypothetical protein